MKFRITLGLLALSLVVGVAPAAAQIVRPNTPFQVQADHSGVETTDYHLLIDNVERQVKPVSSLVNGVITLDAPGLPAGTHTIVVTAVGPGGAGTSAPLSTTINPTTPPPPTGLRILTVQVTASQKGGEE